VVAATAVGGIVASVYYVSLCRRKEHLPTVLPDRRWWLLAAAATPLTVAGELAIVYTGLHGFLALALTGIPTLIGWATIASGLRQIPEAKPETV
jgi:hypothetical protein